MSSWIGSWWNGKSAGSKTSQDPNSSTPSNPDGLGLRNAQDDADSTASKPQRTMENSIASMPETMSCQQAFDIAMGCGNPGGKFRHVYRYGFAGDCKEQWADFWFCMRTRTKADETKRALIQEHYWKKEEKFRAAPNSEDVWEERTDRITTFFDRDPDRDGVFNGLWVGQAPET
jgi:hypothetical protein